MGSDCGIDWLIWKMVLTKMFLCAINLIVNITRATQLFSDNGFENTFMTNSCVNVKLMHYILMYVPLGIKIFLMWIS